MESSARGESDAKQSSAVNEVESGAAETNTESTLYCDIVNTVVFVKKFQVK